MKKQFMVMLLFGLMLMSIPSQAMDFMVGAKAGYFMWYPYFKDMEGSGLEYIEKGDGILYGPSLSLLFTPEISLSVSGLFGQQRSQWDDTGESRSFGPDTFTSTGSNYMAVDRIDIDSALSYQISESFKIFAGCKFQLTDMEYTATFVVDDPDGGGDDYVQNGMASFKTPAVGPALGIGYSLPFQENFFFAANVSMLYMRSNVELISRWDSITIADPELDPGLLEVNQKEQYAMHHLGINLEPSLGGKIGEHVITTVGVRFQWMMNQYVDEPVMSGHKFAPDGWMHDYLIGLFFGVIYII